MPFSYIVCIQIVNRDIYRCFLPGVKNPDSHSGFLARHVFQSRDQQGFWILLFLIRILLPQIRTAVLGTSIDGPLLAVPLAAPTLIEQPQSDSQIRLPNLSQQSELPVAPNTASIPVCRERTEWPASPNVKTCIQLWKYHADRNPGLDENCDRNMSNAPPRARTALVAALIATDSVKFIYP